MYHADSIGGVSLEEILELERLPAAAVRLETVFAAGSLVEGFGNSWSDIDIICIGDTIPMLGFVAQESGVLTSVHFHKGRRVDFEVWQPTVVRSAIQQLNSLEIPRDVNPPALSAVHVRLLHSVRTGTAAVNPDALSELRAHCRFDVLSRYLAERSIFVMDNVFEDVCGMLEDNDLDSAVLLGRELAGLGVDALAHWRGNTNISKKWRIKYAQMCLPRQDREWVMTTFWDIQFPHEQMPHNSPEVMRIYVERCLRFANQIARRVQG